MSRPMTLTQMRSQVYTRLGESAGFYTDANITQWLNDGMDDIALRLEPLVVTATIDLVAGTQEYLLPDDLISIKAVLIKNADSAWVNLELTSFEELFRNNPDWEHDTRVSVPTMWYWRQDVLGIAPPPLTSRTSGLRIVYTCRPEEMDADGDFTNMPSYLDRVCVLYAVYRALLKSRDEQRAILARAEFEKALDQAGQIINKHRKEHAPRLEPKQKGYRRWWYNQNPRFRAWTGDI